MLIPNDINGSQKQKMVINNGNQKMVTEFYAPQNKP